MAIEESLYDEARKIVSGIAKLTNTTASGFTSLASGMSTIGRGTATGASLLDASASLASMVPVVGQLGTAFTEVGKAGLKMADDLRAGTQFGVYFNENLGLYGKTVLGARDSLDSWQARLEKSADSFSHLGSSMDISMVRFGQMAKSMQESPIAMQLESTGIRAEELNDALALTISTQKFVNLNDANAKNSAIASTLKLVTEMDDLARITGLSREQQKKQLEETIKRPDVAAYMMTLSQEQQQSFNRATTKLGAQAETIRSLSAEMAVGKGTIRSEQGVQTAAALNLLDPALLEKLRLGSQLSVSTNAEDQARAAALYEQIGKDMEEAIKRDPEKIQRMAMLGATGDKTAAEFLKIVTELKGLGAETAKKAEVPAGMTLEQYEKQQKEKVDAERKAGVEGPAAVEQAAFKAANGLDRLAKDISAGVGVGFEQLNVETGKLINQYNLLNSLLRVQTAEGIAKIPSDLAKEILNKVTGVESEPETTGRETTPSAVTPTTNEQPSEPRGRYTNPSRMEGSLGTVGKWLEDWGAGTNVTLHGKEGIVTEDQFKMIGNEVNSMLKNVGVSGFGESIKQPAVDNLDLTDKISYEKPIVEKPEVEIKSYLESLNVKKSSEDIAISVKEFNDRLKSLGVTPMSEAFIKSNEDVKSQLKTVTIDLPKAEFTKVITDINTQFKSLGVNITDLATEIETGGIRTQASAEKLASLGITAEEFQKLVSKDNVERIAIMQAGGSPFFKDIKNFIDEVKNTKAQPVIPEPVKEQPNIIDIFSGTITGIGNFVSNTVGEITSEATGAFSTVFDEIDQFTNSTVDSITTGTSTVFNEIGNFASDLLIDDTKKETSKISKNEIIDPFTQIANDIQKEFANLSKEQAIDTSKEKISTIDLSKYGVTTFGGNLEAPNETDLSKTSKINKPPTVIKDNETIKELANSIASMQRDTVTSISQEKESAVARSADLATRMDQIATTTISKPVEKVEPITPPLTMSVDTDIKNELVMLNKQMGQLLSYTGEVAYNSKQQVKATKQASTNNMLG